MQHTLKLFLTVFLLVPTLAFSQNTPPIADAGPDQTLFVDQPTGLAGSATDADGDAIVSWQWAVESSPVGSNPFISQTDIPDPAFIGDVAGDYVLSLIASDGIDWSAPDFVTISVVEILPPVAIATSDVTSGPAPLTVTFDGSQSFGPQGGPLIYSWSFGDGTGSSGAVSAVHVYLLPGTYNAVLSIVDSLGQTDSDTIRVDVTQTANTPPVVSPTATPNTGPAPLVVQFMANASDADGHALTYFWDFGDPASPDNNSTEADPQHIYNAPGTYEALVRVSDHITNVTASTTVVVDPAATLSTISAMVVRNPHRPNKGNVTLGADFDAPVPAHTDVISVVFDGISLVDAPFSAFKAGLKPNVYWLVKRRQLVRLDFDNGRIFVKRNRVNLTPLDNDSGVAVEVSYGSTVGVENIPMEMVSPSLLKYHRAE